MKYVIANVIGASVIVLSVLIAFWQLEERTDTSKLVVANNRFAIDLYQTLAKEERNLIFSPFSISNALAMTFGGAHGETADEIERTAHFGSVDVDIHKAYATLTGDLTSSRNKYDMILATRLWGQQGIAFQDVFLDVMKNSYRAKMEDIDFSTNPDDACQKINIWVKAKTKNKIPQLIPRGLLDNETLFVQTNAIYFKGSWQQRFDPEATQIGVFTTASKEKIAIPMMRQDKLKTNYLKGDNFRILELPYRNQMASMFILLPDEEMDLSDFEKELDFDRLSLWLEQMVPKAVSVTLPQFVAMSSFDLKGVLKEMGMPSAFDPNRADFSKICSQQLYLGTIVHKALIEVNEEGTEATAATAVSGKKSEEKNISFLANRPFVYIIRDNTTGAILFMGRLTNPREKVDNSQKSAPLR